MSFIKALMLAIFATIFLTYILGASFLSLFDLQVYVNNDIVEPMKAIGVSAGVAVILVLVALAVVLSVFGSIIFVGVLVVGSIAMAIIGVFWPILLAAFIIWAVTRNKDKPRYAPSSSH
ncbi:MAG: hypothetical protein ACPGTQ_07305 [Colwellia sp.]